MFIVLSLFVHTAAYAQDGYFHPEKDGDKWGVQRNYNKLVHGNTDYVSEWTHKAKYDLVLYDTIRCRLTGNGCAGFFSFKKGKMGYLWSNGNKLDNEYDAINIYERIAKKDGKWGGFDEENNIIPFEYDSLLAITYSRPDWNGDTASVKFAAKKNGKWKLIVARSWTKWEQTEVKDLLPDEFDGYIKSGIVKKEGKWFFFSWDKQAKYSQPYDSIKRVYGDHAVQKDKKWALIYEGTTPSTGYEWDDVMACPHSTRYLLVQKDGKYGLVSRRTKDFKVVVPPQASTINVANDEENAQIVAMINGNTTTFSPDGKMLSGTGDLSVNGLSVKGPFKITYHDDGKTTVADSASGKVILPKDYWRVEYANDPAEGHILKILKQTSKYDRYYEGKHGLYQYSSGTLIDGVYDDEFKDAGPGYFMNTTGSTTTIWSKKDFHKLVFPGAVTQTSSWNGWRVKAGGDWYTVAEPPVKLDAAKLVKWERTWGSVISYNEMEDGSVVITKMGGAAMSQRASSVTELYDGRLLQIKTGDKTEVWTGKNGQAIRCQYATGSGAYIRQCLSDLDGGPLVLWVDSATTTVLVNVIDNRRLVLPYPTASSYGKAKNGGPKDGYYVKVNDKLYSFCRIGADGHVRLCRDEKCTCGNGKIVADRKMVGTEDKYVAPKTTTTTKSNYENTWNSGTNSYQGVTTKRTETHTDPGYTIKGNRHEEVTYKTCPRCNGTGKLADGVSWSGVFK